MANLSGSIDYVLENEGGFSDDAEDSGGATNWGITHTDLAQYLGHSVSTDDVRNMSKTLAQNVYLALYWNPMDLNLVLDQNVATAIFDCGVNRGISKGIKYAQQIAGVSQDGHMGPITLAAINEMPRDQFINSFHSLVVDGYNAIVYSRPSQRVFLKGWLARADRLLTLF